MRLDFAWCEIASKYIPKLIPNRDKQYCITGLLPYRTHDGYNVTHNANDILSHEDVFWIRTKSTNGTRKARKMDASINILPASPNPKAREK